MRLGLLTLLLGAAACAADERPDRAADSEEIRADVEELALDDGGDAGACTCADDACFGAWVEANVGCGVCVHATCGDRTLEACVPCDP